MLYAIGLILALGFIILGIVRWKIHPFFVLLLAAMGYGFISGMDVQQIIASINDGFGSIMGKIGLIIFFGVAIGTLLEKSGGALVIATQLLRLLGEKSVHLAMMFTGFILSIPVFADSSFIIMNSLNKAITHKAKLAFGGTTAALALGLTATHVFVPPTPRPIAAADVVGADLGSLIFWGLIVSIFALIPCYFFATRIASRVNIPIQLEPPASTSYQPRLSYSILCILIPILLIVGKSIVDFPANDFSDTWFYPIISFLGTPVIALLIGVALGL